MEFNSLFSYFHCFNFVLWLFFFFFFGFIKKINRWKTVEKLTQLFMAVNKIHFFFRFLLFLFSSFFSFFVFWWFCWNEVNFLFLKPCHDPCHLHYQQNKNIFALSLILVVRLYFSFCNLMNIIFYLEVNDLTQYM